MVVELGPAVRAWATYPGGQSGNPFSPHYGDLFALWQRGAGVAAAFSPEQVKAATVQTLEVGVAKGK